jgi:pantoate kinase
MANTPEALVKKRIRKILEDSHTYFAMPIGTGYGNSGVPDFLVCSQGDFIAIEAKAGKGKTTALQESHLAKIRATGGIALVINEANIHELKGILNGRTLHNTADN